MSLRDQIQETCGGKCVACIAVGGTPTVASLASPDTDPTVTCL